MFWALVNSDRQLTVFRHQVLANSPQPVMYYNLPYYPSYMFPVAIEPSKLPNEAGVVYVAGNW